MIEERLAKLLSRKLSGEATPAEMQELEVRLQNNQADQHFVDILLTYWNKHSDSSAVNSASDKHFAHILEMAEENSENRSSAELATGYKKANLVLRLKKLAIAASLAGFVTLSIWLIIDKSKTTIGSYTKNNQPKNEIVASKGARSRLVLPDGTQVWLNSDSKLQYEGSFNDTIREVILEGEAYFDVVKDAQRPFIVHASAIDIRVLGTSFNVKAYPQEKTIETTLIHGSVVVTDKNRPQSPKIILRPKEKLVFDKNETDLAETSYNNNPVNALRDNGSARTIIGLPKNVADTSLKETSWIYNRLVFEGDTFRELAVKMERWFNVNISFKSEKIANYRLRGVFEDENIEQALQALQVITPFSYKINNNDVTINH